MPTYLKDKEVMINEPISIANRLNKHFIQKGIKLASSLPQTNHSIFENMKPRVTDSIPNINFETRDVSKCINDLKPNKASGHDSISPKIIKCLVEIISPILTEIFNKFLSAGKYPDFFKVAKVTALFKNGDKSSVENYRPISVLPQLNQVFEKLLHGRLTSFLTENDILNKNQYGFRKGHSTSHAITHLNEKLIENLEKSMFVLSCSLISSQLSIQ